MSDEKASGERLPSAEQPTLLGQLAPDEMYARGMQSVKMTSGAGGTWQPPTLEEISRLFAHYEILSLLGRGGMGAVYKARQTMLDRWVAIKLLPLEISVDQDFTDRFVREARAMARLHHSNIITVHDFGKTSEGHLFFVMEYVEGANLYDIIHQVGLNEEQALAIVEQVCAALDYAHHKGIVHRDIKPANVMIDVESHVKVADFGLARLTDCTATDLGHTVTGAVMGTPDYMAPEQTRGMNVDHRADVYSVGVMLYEMLCREVPRGIFHPPSKCIGCDRRIDEIVIKAMQQAPEDRYQSSREMKADVATARTPLVVAIRPPQALAELPAAGPVRPDSPQLVVLKATPVVRPKKSKLPLFAGMAAAIILAGAALHFLPSNKRPLERAPDAAPAPASPATATKENPFVNSLGMKFVPVPGTLVLFSIWDTRVQDYREFAAASNVRDSWTKQEKDGVPVSRDRDYPVAGVSWDDAQAFAQWLTQKEHAEGRLPPGAKYRLPTDVEWSLAVGLSFDSGSTPKEKSGKNSVDFPWGRDFPHGQRVGNYADETFHATFPADENAAQFWNRNLWIKGYTDGFATTSPVGSFPANACGLYDMGGNVWQWCEDWFDATHTERVQRGGAWDDAERIYLLSSHRFHTNPGWTTPHFGFRCVLEPPEK